MHAARPLRGMGHGSQRSPQLMGEPSGAQEVPQRWVPMAQGRRHCPLVQRAGEAQVLPQAPQLSWSREVSVQPERGHQVCGAEQAQRPSAQKAPAPQEVPQVPQWAPSDWGLTHTSPQRRGVAAGHEQAPPRHARPPPQGVSLGSASNTQ